MIEVVQRPSVRKSDKPDVIMSRMDYVIICQVIKRLNEIGMTDDELSFLLGKANNYVFGFIIKPSDKNRFNEDQIDLLPYILGYPFSKIIPNGAEPGNIQLYHTGGIPDDDTKDFPYRLFSQRRRHTHYLEEEKCAERQHPEN